MLLKNLIKSPPQDLKKLNIKGLAVNSKKVREGFIFFAFQGENIDGNDFIEEAFNNGACLVVSDSDKVISPRNIIKVDNVRLASGIACSNYYNFPQNKLFTFQCIAIKIS